MVQVITSPFTGVWLNVAELLPTFILFNFHWYIGFVPPFVAFAVKVTNVPEHKVVAALLLIAMVGVCITIGVTDKVLVGELPQPLLAATAILPLLLPTVRVMVLVVEVPVQPGGNVQA